MAATACATIVQSFSVNRITPPQGNGGNQPYELTLTSKGDLGNIESKITVKPQAPNGDPKLSVTYRSGDRIYSATWLGCDPGGAYQFLITQNGSTVASGTIEPVDFFSDEPDIKGPNAQLFRILVEHSGVQSNCAFKQ